MTRVAYSVPPVLLNCFEAYRRCVIGNRLSLLGLLRTRFEAAVEGDAKLYFRNNYPHYWLTSWNIAPSEAALTHLRHHTLTDLKMSMIPDTLSDLLAPLLAFVRSPFQAGYSTGQTKSRCKILFPNCCNIPEAKDMSPVRHTISCAHLASFALPKWTQSETCSTTYLAISVK